MSFQTFETLTRTQIKISFMKSESFLTLYRQQGNYYIQGPER